jgi:hypothetical protein
VELRDSNPLTFLFAKACHVDTGVGAEPEHVGDQGGPGQGDEPNAGAEQRYEGDNSDWSRDGQQDGDGEGLAGEDCGGGCFQLPASPNCRDQDASRNRPGAEQPSPGCCEPG